MQWKSFQSEAFRLTEQEIEKLIPYIIKQYKEAIKSIDKELKKVYTQILSGVAPIDYHNTMLKYDRLTKLLETVQKQYITFSKEAGKTIGQAGQIAASNNYYRTQYAYKWLVPGIDFAILPEDIIKMSVFGSTEAWKSYTASLLEKIYGSPLSYWPQAGTLSEFLVSNRIKELENIQRAITQGIIQGHSYTKTSRAIRNVIGQYLVKDGVPNVTGAMANSVRIVRTETIRIMNQAAEANTQYARSQGVEIVRVWNATLDNRTRPVHAALDNKEEDKNGFFQSSVGPVRGPGQFPMVGQNVHCRCTTFESVNGSRPTLRRGTNIVKYNQELALAKKAGLKKQAAEDRALARSREVFDYKDFEKWASEQGLKKNKFGQYVNGKK